MKIQNILIVEDSRLINNAINDRLTSNGLTCHSAYDLKSSYEIYDSVSIDLIILDLHLPDGNGEDFILDIKSRSNNKNAKIVIFTSSSDLLRRDELFRLGIVDYLDKGKHADLIIKGILTIVDNLNRNQNHSILIVDDSAVVRLMMTTLLEPQGFNVIQSKSVEEAQDILEKNSSISIILLDLEMHGISGMEFLTSLKSTEKFSSIPVLVVSSHSSVDLVRDVFKNGASDFFKKPFPPEEFLLKIQQQINHQASIELYKNTQNSQAEFEDIIQEHFLIATFKKNGKIVSSNDAFNDYFKEIDVSLQKIFTPFFNTAVIKNIINSQRNMTSYKDTILDLSGNLFALKCFTSHTHDSNNEFTVVLLNKN